MTIARRHARILRRRKIGGVSDERASRPLWHCAEREVANVNQSQACGRHSLESHLAGKDPHIRAIFDEFVDGHVVLARRAGDPLFRKVGTFSKRNHLHAFRLHSAEEITPELVAFLREAYPVGAQEHLRT
jgi:hypothetical protein